MARALACRPGNTWGRTRVAPATGKPGLLGARRCPPVNPYPSQPTEGVTQMMETVDAETPCGEGLIGRMVCVDYAGCGALEVLRDETVLRAVMDELCEEIGIQVVSKASKSFGPD